MKSPIGTAHNSPEIHFRGKKCKITPGNKLPVYDGLSLRDRNQSSIERLKFISGNAK
ncbi:MAG: hypothetical protein HC887_03565 [Desulfobacteraceae bacterium]|nr:hypothetical protein [Desulfobacteraceae bacterium]